MMCLATPQTCFIFIFKHLKRTGWVLRNVGDCETISGHMYRMALMTFLLDGTKELNRTKCMELGLSFILFKFCWTSNEQLLYLVLISISIQLQRLYMIWQRVSLEILHQCAAYQKRKNNGEN